jgi:hypothetical protein
VLEHRRARPPLRDRFRGEAGGPELVARQPPPGFLRWLGCGVTVDLSICSGGVLWLGEKTPRFLLG